LPISLITYGISERSGSSEKSTKNFTNIFVQTQAKAQAFVDKLLEDKSNRDGVFCNFLSWLDENSIRVSPVWKMEQCNGWMVELNFDTP